MNKGSENNMKVSEYSKTKMPGMQAAKVEWEEKGDPKTNIIHVTNDEDSLMERCKGLSADHYQEMFDEIRKIYPYKVEEEMSVVGKKVDENDLPDDEWEKIRIEDNMGEAEKKFIEVFGF